MTSHPHGVVPAHWSEGDSAVPISDPSPPADVALVSVATARMTLRARAFRDAGINRLRLDAWR